MAGRWGTVFLYVENLRTNRNIPSFDDYANWSGTREATQNTPFMWARNVIQNVRMDRFSFLYPREQLYQKIFALLGIVRESVADWNDESSRFLKVWDRFN